jgi:hypothetical protein
MPLASICPTFQPCIKSPQGTDSQAWNVALDRSSMPSSEALGALATLSLDRVTRLSNQRLQSHANARFSLFSLAVGLPCIVRTPTPPEVADAFPARSRKKNKPSTFPLEKKIKK